MVSFYEASGVGRSTRLRWRRRGRSSLAVKVVDQVARASSELTFPVLVGQYAYGWSLQGTLRAGASAPAGLAAARQPGQGDAGQLVGGDARV